MWIAIGILGGFVFMDTLLIWILMFRLRWAEAMIVMLSTAQSEEIIDYLKSRTHHPAGKKLQNGK